MIKLSKTKVIVDGREINVFSNIADLFKQSKRTTEQFYNSSIIKLKRGYLEVDLRFDDQCGNGHNSFSITGTVYSTDPRKVRKDGKRTGISTCGCIHDIIIQHAPQYAKYIKWHLTNTSGPMFYIENTSFWVKEYLNFDYLDYRPFDTKEKYLEAARSCAVWSDATIEELGSELALYNRLPALMQEFKADMEELGFIW